MTKNEEVIIDKYKIPTASIVMVGEAGKEAVMPLENNTGWITDLASKVADRMPQTNKNDSINLNIELDGSVIAQVVLNYLNKMQKENKKITIV